MRRLLETILFGIAGCGGGPPLLSLSEVPAAGATLELRPVLEGKVGAAVNTPLGALPQRKRTLRLELREPLRGAPLFAQVYDSAGCLVAWGQAAADQPLVLSAVTDCPNQGQRGPVLRSASAALLPAERPTELTLRGSGLLPGVVIQGDGQPLPHTWVSPLEVRVTAPAAPGGLGRTLPLSALFEQQEARLAAAPRYYEATIKLGAPQLQYSNPTGVAPAWTVVVGDINRDGHPDLLHGAGGPFRVIYNQTERGESALRFSSPAETDATKSCGGGCMPLLLTTGSEGILDLAYYVFSNSSRVFLRRGFLQTPAPSSSAFSAEENVLFTPSPGTTSQALAADVDGDRKTDLIVYTYEPIGRKGGQFTVLRNSGLSGTLQTVSTASACATFASGSGYLHLDDDGRGAPLFITPEPSVLHVFRFSQLGLCPERTDVRSVSYLPGLPLFTLGGPRVITGGTSQLLADVNGDGLPDLLSAPINEAPSLSLWTNRGDTSTPSFQKQPDQVIPLLSDMTLLPARSRVRAADLNGDGRPDVVVGLEAGSGAATLLTLVNQPAP